MYPVLQPTQVTLPQYNDLPPNTNSAPSIEPLINFRWNPIKVSSIESVVVVNKTYYTENESANINGIAVNLMGRLKNADVQISFKLPYSIPAESIASRVTSDVSFATEETIVELGYVGKFDEKKAELLSNGSAQVCKIILPLFRGMPQRKPLMDNISLGGQPWIHYTFTFSGVELPSLRNTSWRIRVKAWPLEDNIQCVSVNNDAIDMPRIQESFSNLKSYIKGIASKIETAFASKPRTTQVLPQNASNQTYPTPTDAKI